MVDSPGQSILFFFLRWSKNWSRPFALSCTFFPHDAITLAVALQKSRLPKQTCRYTLSSYQITVPGVEMTTMISDFHLFSLIIILSFTQSFIRSFIRSFTHPSIHPSIHPFIHSFISLLGAFSPPSFAYTGKPQLTHQLPSVSKITPHGNSFVNPK